MKKATLLLLALVLMTASVPAGAEAETGAPAPAFSLPDLNGSVRSSSEFAGRTIVLEWTNYECPFVKKHYESGNMQKLQEEYAAKGVVWLSVNSSAEGKQGNYSAEEWKKRSAAWAVKSAAILLDADGTVGRAYGAKTTPHIFVIDSKGTLVYKGAIDDRPGTDPAEIAEAKSYARAALDETLSGKPVSEPSTKSYGCSVKY